MLIPKQVKIGAITYKVIVTDGWHGIEGADGENFSTIKMGNTIYINSTLTQEMKELTFLHEMMHAMNSTISHEFLDSLANQLYQTLKDANLLK
jgi:Zn-dependent peptidase ImmA (M78 family)